MTHEPDASTTDFADRLVADLQLSAVTCLRDEVLVIGLKDGFANLQTPAGEQGPMDHPTKGLVLLVGPKCMEAEISIWPGMVVHFAKFQGAEIQTGGRRFFSVKGGEVKLRERVTAEKAQELSRNFY